MTQNIYDTATDILKERVQNAYGQIRKEYKSANPYRQQAVSPREKLYRYEEIRQNPELWASLKTSMGLAFDVYVSEMETLKNRYTPQGGEQL